MPVGIWLERRQGSWSAKTKTNQENMTRKVVRDALGLKHMSRAPASVQGASNSLHECQSWHTEVKMVHKLTSSAAKNPQRKAALATR